MHEDNVCRFIASENRHVDIVPLHFVFETNEQKFDKWNILAYNRMHFVLSGSAFVYTQTGKYPLKKGDLFFSLASRPYGLESENDFHYVYVGFTGTRAAKIIDFLGISEKKFIFPELAINDELWKAALSLPVESLKLYSEGLLLCAFAQIAALNNEITSKGRLPEIGEKLKKYIDENFNNPDLTLDYISKEFSYNKKYLSKVFKEEFKINYSDYLNQIRIQNACSLIERGMESVQDIAHISGFSDALYFSKVFKGLIGVSPRKHILLMKQQKNNVKPI